MSAIAPLVSESWLSSVTTFQISSPNTALCGVVLLVITLSPFLLGTGRDAKELSGFPITNAWTFFSKRFDFLWGNFHKITGNIFKFRVLQYTVVAIRGEEARKAFFDDRNLNFTEGYKILMGASPDLNDIGEDLKTEKSVTEFNKRLVLLLNRNRLSDVFPTLMEDVNQRMLGWGKEGRFDPFQNIYTCLVFQMTVRMASCDELATNYEDMHLLQRHYWDLEKSAMPVALLLPWFPGPAKKKKEAATTGLYTTLKKYVDMRKTAETPSSDAIDVLLYKGDAEHEIISAICALVIFAGVINTGMNASSMLVLLFLASNPEWREKVKAEIDELIAKHTVRPPVWENETPIVDTVIRETLRLVLNATALRCNVVDDTEINGHRIAKGEFLAYSIYDTHMNPEIYFNPSQFDPDRYSPGREEDKKSTFAYVGWGAGRHPCTGMKVAKLELKAIIALFLARYDYNIIDASGNYPKCIPRPDYNDIHSVRPVGEPCFFQFKRKFD
ncbi:cytochrome P450 [Cyathus striatus]|nr:cytochrome P450 [Cyathus striatus]